MTVQFPIGVIRQPAHTNVPTSIGPALSLLQVKADRSGFEYVNLEVDQTVIDGVQLVLDRSVGGRMTLRQVIQEPPVVERDYYFGWSDTRVVTAAEFPAADDSNNGRGVIPNRNTDGYLWVAGEDALGDLSAIYIGQGGRNQIAHFDRQAGIVAYQGKQFRVYVAETEAIPAYSGAIIHVEH